jgi:hypothetical protein
VGITAGSRGVPGEKWPVTRYNNNNNNIIIIIIYNLLLLLLLLLAYYGTNKCKPTEPSPTINQTS